MSFSRSSPRSLFGRADCIPCPDTIPSCPTCADGMKCSVSVRTCDTCPTTTCITDPTAAMAAANAAAAKSSGPNVGAIAGGVIGGVAAIAIIVYLTWRFFIKKKRTQYEAEYVDQYSDEATEAEKEFSARRDARASTHTVASIASTVLTRASNIIQIAYIPGVTNRSSPSTPGLLVPPVPPIPIALSSSSTPSYEDQHFFMPGDLRDSTYSAMTDRTSYAPRSSVASTIYGKHAVVSPVPAQTVMRGKAAVISVKSSGANTPGDMTPPVPSVDYSKYQPGSNLQPPPSPAFSVGSTFLNSASAATQMRPTVVRVVATNGKAEKVKGAAESDEEGSSGSVSVGRESAAITIIDDTPSLEQGPFSDPPQASGGHVKNKSLGDIIEEAAKKTKGGVSEADKKEEKTPFGDEHATD